MRMNPDNFKEVEQDGEDELEYIKEPFNPQSIDIVVEQRSIDSIIARIAHNEIDMNPEFQRKGNLWNEGAMSRLIESILVRFPLPAFYFDASDDDKWLVVDGLQRLYTLKRFVVDCENPSGDLPLRLKNLEFLKDFEGKIFTDLPHTMKRRIRESHIMAYLIKPGTPEEVKYSIFYRINTGGLILNQQEIRHALNQKGIAVKYLAEIADCLLFKDIVNISNQRMQDRELVLRHLAFRLKSYREYKPTMKNFLNQAMKTINAQAPQKLEQLKSEFLISLEFAYDIFGQNVFTKSIVSEDSKSKKAPLNRSLFEVITVIFASLSSNDRESLLINKKEFIQRFRELLNESDFDNSISSSTADTTAVQIRFGKFTNLVNDIIEVE